MTEKHYDTDWAKAKARALQQEFPKEHICNRKRPEETYVLCLPGIDAAELQIYDNLGIPRGNITGLEREPHVARELQKKNLGIRVIQRSLEDYVQDEAEFAFDVVSLDFIGPLNLGQIDALKVLREKQKVHRFVLHCAHLLTRDKQSQGFYIAGQAARTLQGNFPELLGQYSPDRILHINAALTIQVEAAFEKAHEEGFDQADKSEAYSQSLRTGLQGFREGGSEELFRFLAGVGNYETKKAAALAAISEVKDRKNGQPLSENRRWERYLSEHMYADLHKAVKLRCKCKGLPEELALLMFNALTITAAGKPFFVAGENYRRYSYISESGSPMIGDIYLAERLPEFLRACKKVAQNIGYPRGFLNWNNQALGASLRDLSLAIPKTQKYMLIETQPPKEREFLGNSAKPILTKKRFLAELDAGHSIEEVSLSYRGFSNKPLDVWRSEYAQGAPPLVQDETLEEEAGLEKITKEEAVDLLSSGVPPEEVCKVYPSSFSLGQLRAYKAHLTMGTYEKELEHD